MAEPEIFKIGRPCQCGSVEMIIGQAWATSGARLYPFVCRRCGKVQQQYAKKLLALSESARIGGLPEVKTATQNMPDKFAKMRADYDSRKCEVCGAGDAQFHHWAPYHLFGVESERWPRGLLCQECHTRWHQIVTPNMGNIKD